MTYLYPSFLRESRSVISGEASITRWSDGTQNWPDSACNPTRAFGYCDTNDQDKADVWVTYVCQQNG